MRFSTRFWILIAISFCLSTGAAEGKIIKVLPHFLDIDGRHTLHPSLFERDSYQAELKNNPERVSAMRFDVLWKARKLEKPRLKLEVRGAKTPARQVETFEQDLAKGKRFSQWTGLRVPGEDFKRLGSIIAWRISLWDGEKQIAEQESFLWQTGGATAIK